MYVGILRINEMRGGSFYHSKSAQRTEKGDRTRKKKKSHLYSNYMKLNKEISSLHANSQFTEKTVFFTLFVDV